MLKPFFIFLFSFLIAIPTYAKQKVPVQCKDILDTVFECATPEKHKILVCRQENRYEYRFIRHDQQEDTIVNLALAQLQAYPLSKQKEALGFKTASQEYKVFAYYKKSIDANNIFDDNVNAGVEVIRNNKVIQNYSCAHTPESISISDVILLKKTKQNTSKQIRANTQNKQTDPSAKKNQPTQKTNIHNNKQNQIKAKPSTQLNGAKTKYQKTEKKAQKPQKNIWIKPQAKKNSLPKHVTNIKGLIDFLDDDN